jgi:propanol-preferring alcohol dehydrogenase
MCHTELHFRDGLLDLGCHGVTMGHEVAGVIDRLGEGVDPARLGERVMVYYYEGCGACEYCRSGDEHLCPATKAQPGFSTDGGYADYMVVRATNCIVVPDHVPLEEIAPMACAGTTAVHAGRMAKIKPGEWVVIHGTGGVGLALLQYARHVGGRVIAIDRNQQRLELALALGAEHGVNAAGAEEVAAQVLALTGGVHVVFELVGRQTTMQASLDMLRRKGRYVLVGYSADTLSVHPIDLIVRELQVMGSVGSTLQDAHDIVDLVGRGVIRSFVDRTIALEDFEQGLQALEQGHAQGRVVIRFDQRSL